MFSKSINVQIYKCISNKYIRSFSAHVNFGDKSFNQITTVDMGEKIA